VLRVIHDLFNQTDNAETLDRSKLNTIFDQLTKMLLSKDAPVSWKASSVSHFAFLSFAFSYDEAKTSGLWDDIDSRLAQ
jgi:hypothetical protein